MKTNITTTRKSQVFEVNYNIKVQKKHQTNHSLQRCRELLARESCWCCLSTRSMERGLTQQRKMECQGREKRMVGLRDWTGGRDRDPAGDVVDGELLWPFSSNRGCSKHRLQLSKAMGLFGGSCFSLLFLYFFFLILISQSSNLWKSNLFSSKHHYFSYSLGL